MKDKIRIELEMEQKVCGMCKKNSPEYYELKFQMRFKFYENEDIQKIKYENLEYINKNFKGINKIKEFDYGFDVYFASKEIMNKLSSLFQKKYLCDEVRSKKILGHNTLETKDIWRHVLLINIINLKRNDHISIKGKNYYIKALNKNDLVLRGLEDGEKKVVTYSIIKDYIQKI